MILKANLNDVFAMV